MPRYVLVLLFLSLPTLATTARTAPLTLREAIAHARSAAPAVIAARMRVAEARAGLIGPSMRFSSNPSLEIDAGRRSGETSTSEFGVSVAQDLDLPAVRRARIDIAQSLVVQEEHRARLVERESVLEVARLYLRALEARERADGADAAKRLAEEASLIAQRRYAAGDVAQLDVNLARTAVARAESESQIATATLTGLASTLQVLLRLDALPEVSGKLHDAVDLGSTNLAERALNRSDVRLLDAEIALVEAERRLAETMKWPQLGLRASFSEEEGDRILLGGVGFTLPLFQRGRQERVLAGAKLSRLRAEREALTRTITAQVRGASATVAALRRATEEYERRVLPLISENERLALESYESGQIGLSDLLVIRGDALDARRALLDQLVQTRLAEVELHALAGVTE